MRQGILVKNEKIIVNNDAEMPKIKKEDEVIVKIRYCGINADDYSGYIGELGRIYADNRLFHEISGEIHELGKTAAMMGFKKGDRVSRNVLSGCGHCPICRRGLSNLCTDMETPGGSAEYVRYDAKSLVKLPDEVGLDEGCLYWLAVTCIRCVEKMNLEFGSSVVIFGAGGTGLMLLQIVKLRMPSLVIVVEPIESKRETAVKLGADIVVDPVNEVIDDSILEFTYGLGVDAVIDASGSCASKQNMTDILGRGGKLMLFSNYRVDESITINLMEMYWKEYTIYSSYGATRSYYTGIETDIFRNLDIKSVIDQILPLEDMEKGMRMYGSGRYKRILINVQ